MKCVKVDLSQDITQLKIEIFSDLHIGSKKCNYEEIQNRIDKVKNDPNTYAIFLGDLCNNSTKTSVGDVYEEELTPMQQIQKAVMMFYPIKDKIIGITSGNHERRSYKTDGIDLMYFFANELGLADKYDYTACLLFVRFGRLNAHLGHKRVCYTIYMTHGDGNGGRTIGGKTNGLQRRGQIVDSDIVVTGHTHAPMTFRDCYYEINYGTSSIVKKEQMFVNASATLDYESYAELFGMKPGSIVSPVIVLDGTKHHMSTIV